MRWSEKQRRMNCNSWHSTIVQVAPDVVVVSLNKSRVRVELSHPLVGAALQNFDCDPRGRANSLSAVNAFVKDVFHFKQPPAYCAMCRVAACSRTAHGAFDFDRKCNHAGGAAADHSGLAIRGFLQTGSSS